MSVSAPQVVEPQPGMPAVKRRSRVATPESVVPQSGRCEVRPESYPRRSGPSSHPAQAHRPHQGRSHRPTRLPRRAPKRRPRGSPGPWQDDDLPNIAHQAVLHGHSVLFLTAAQLLLDLGAQESARGLDKDAPGFEAGLRSTGTRGDFHPEFFDSRDRPRRGLREPICCWAATHRPASRQDAIATGSTGHTSAARTRSAAPDLDRDIPLGAGQPTEFSEDGDRDRAC